MKISQSKLERFVQSVVANPMNETRKQRALKFIDELPLTQNHVDAIRRIDDEDFVNAAEAKHDQMVADTVSTFEEAVEKGIDNLDDLVAWMGITFKPEFKDTYREILDVAHLYKTTGAPVPSVARLGE